MTGSGSLDATVSEFLELEAELDSGTRRSTTYDEGVIAQANKVPAETVPEGYPIPIETRHALQIGVEVENGDVIPIYIEWPEDDEDSDHVDRLLDALGRDPDEFANIYGDRVALDNVEGWHGIDDDRTARFHRGRKAAGDRSLARTRIALVAAVAAGIVGNAAALASISFSTQLVGLSWLAIPGLVYVDANRIEDVTGWSPATKRWVAGSVLPFVNVSVGIVYLLHRHVQLSELERRALPKTWHWTIVAATVLPFVSLFVIFTSLVLWATLFFFPMFVLPFAIYFDAEQVESATNTEVNQLAWTIGAICLGPLTSLAYLLNRRRLVG